MIVSNIFFVIENLDARDRSQFLGITQRQFVTRRDLVLEIRQIAKPHCRLEFVHLRVEPAKIDVRRLVIDSEIAIQLESLLQTRIFVNEHAAFDAVENLDCMEADHRNVAEKNDMASVNFCSECLRRVEDQLQIMFCGNLFNAFDIARNAEDMRRNDCGSFFRDQFFDFVRIDVVSIIDIAKNGRQTAADDCVCGGNKSKRRSNDFSVQFQRMQRNFECRMPVDKQIEVRMVQILLQFRFECTEFRSVVCHGSRLPNGFDLVDISIKIRQNGTRRRYKYFRHINFPAE